MRTNPLILIVEDNIESLEILQARLMANDYDVITASDGKAGLEMALESHPDLILLDILMPEMDGLEVCRHLKQNKSLPFMPIILVTAKADSKDIIAGLEAGGDEYLTKPVNHGALLARVKSMLRLKKLHDTVLLQTKELKDQLKTASRVQSLFWPQNPKLASDSHIWAVSQPASYVGGDLYDIIALPDGSLISYVADVSGKGVPAALVMAALSMRIKTEATAEEDLVSMLITVNNSLYELTCEEGYFATIILVRYWPLTGKACLIRAGHPYPLLIRDGSVEKLSTLQGISLGITRDPSFETCEIQLLPGDDLLLFSDGVPEAVNDSHQYFGEDRLISHLEKISTPPRAKIILENVTMWRGGADVNDDITFLEIWRKDNSKGFG